MTRLTKWVIVASLTTSGVAAAQTAPEAPAQPAPVDPAQPAPAEATPEAPRRAAVEEMVVTGSRVRRKDLNAPAPVTVLTRDQIAATGRVSLGEFLQALPEQGNSGANAQVNNGNDGSIRVALRSLGAQRTLVLVNGRRMVAGGTGADVSADLSTIPAAAIDRIEILKDGASAIYGSDAIAGVVNVILRKRYSGTEVSGYAGASQRGDGQTYDLHALTGTASDTGSILLSLGYQEQRSILAGDRDFSKTTYKYRFDGNEGITDPKDPLFKQGTGCFADPNTGVCVSKEKSANGNSTTFPNGRFKIPQSACTSAAVGTHPALASICAQSDGGGGNFMQNPAQPGAEAYVPYDNAQYNTNPTNYLLTPSRRIQLFSTGDVNLGSSARAFFEASYVNRTSQTSLAPMPLVNNTIPNAPVTVSKDSIYNPFGVDISSWRLRTVQFGERHTSQDLDTFRVVAGLDGSLPQAAGPLSGWAWSVDFNHGRTAGNQLNTGQLRMPNIAAATGPSAVVNGQAVCLRQPYDPSGATPGSSKTPNIIAGCVPFDVLHGTSATQKAAQAYVSYDGTDFGTNQQDIWTANLSGDLFTIAASRPVGLALGADYRRESASFQNNPINGNSESSGNNAQSTNGGYNVKEAYAELVVPLLSGITAVEDLEAQAAARYNDYSTFGTNSTYKVGLRYSPVRDLTVRSTYGTAFRAPNVAELYGGATDSFPFVSDPCSAPTDPAIRARCVAHGVPGGASGDNSSQLLTRIFADPKLQPETATTFTIGAVIEPRMIRNLSITIDYYNLNVKNAITTHTPNVSLSGCYVTGSAPELCQNVIRDATGTIVQINDPRANLGSYHTTGLDLALRYALALEGVGRFSIIFDGTYLNSLRNTDSSGIVIEGAGNYDMGALPRIKFNSGLFWTSGAFGAGASARYVGGYHECNAGGDFLCAEDDTQQHRIPAYTTVDLFASYTLKDWVAGTTNLVVGVQNVGDVQPPFLATSLAANSDPSTYDYAGRFFYTRLTHKF